LRVYGAGGLLDAWGASVRATNVTILGEATTSSVVSFRAGAFYRARIEGLSWAPEATTWEGRLSLEFLSREGASPAHRPALLFIHGGFHGAWCWDEHFLPWFAQKGWQAHALSLRGHARADDRDAIIRHVLDDYVEDVESVLGTLQKPVVLIGHSMGGVVAQRCMARRKDVAGAVMLAASPLRPAFGVVLQILRRHPVSFVRAQVLGDAKAARRAMASFFFDDALDAATRARYVGQLTAESSTLDLFTRPPLVVDPSERRPVLVVAGRDDWSIPLSDHEALRDAYRAEFAVCPGAHDLMLSLHWKAAAEAIRQWLEAKFDRA
jgi:pimeloyl-ACP methyl ester carboxylesterase